MYMWCHVHGGGGGEGGVDWLTRMCPGTAEGPGDSLDAEEQDVQPPGDEAEAMAEDQAELEGDDQEVGVSGGQNDGCPGHIRTVDLDFVV